MTPTDRMYPVSPGAAGDGTIPDPISATGFSRRDLFRKSGLGVAAAAFVGLPLDLTASASRASAQAAEDPDGALVLALKLKYLESAFYARALTTDYPIPFLPDELQVLTQIAKHEAAHVTVLKAALGAAAPVQPAVSSYDFTAGSGNGCGPFRGAFGAPEATAPDGSVVAEEEANKTEFLKLAMLLEDLGVRALKGCLGALLGTSHLSTMFGIHLVEARHSAEIRMLRNSYDTYDPSGTTYTAPLLVDYFYVAPWIMLSDSGGVGFADYAYAGTPMYEGGLSQQDIANGIVTTTTASDDTVVQTTVMPGVYGPSNPVQAVPVASAGEDNMLQSSSQASNVIVAVGAADAFDEPLATTSAARIAALFGVVS